MVRFDVFWINVVSRIDGNEMHCAIYGVNVDDSNVFVIACSVAWADNPHPCVSVWAVPHAVKPMDDGARIYCP